MHNFLFLPTDMHDDSIKYDFVVVSSFLNHDIMRCCISIMIFSLTNGSLKSVLF